MPEILDTIVDIFPTPDGYGYWFMDSCGHEHKSSGKSSYSHAWFSARENVRSIIKYPTFKRGDIASGQWWQVEEEKEKMYKTLEKYKGIFHQKEIERWETCCRASILLGVKKLPKKPIHKDPNLKSLCLKPLSK